MTTRLATPRNGVILAALELALVALVIPIGIAAHTFSLLPSVTALLVLAFLGIGLLVAYKRPTQLMGWLLLGVSGFLLVSGFGGPYSVLDYTDHHGKLPLGPVAVVLDPSWAPAITLLVLCILLYPEGRVPSSRCEVASRDCCK